MKKLSDFINDLPVCGKQIVEKLKISKSDGLYPKHLEIADENEKFFGKDSHVKLELACLDNEQNVKPHWRTAIFPNKAYHIYLDKYRYNHYHLAEFSDMLANIMMWPTDFENFDEQDIVFSSNDPHEIVEEYLRLLGISEAMLNKLKSKYDLKDDDDIQEFKNEVNNKIRRDVKRHDNVEYLVDVLADKDVIDHLVDRDESYYKDTAKILELWF